MLTLYGTEIWHYRPRWPIDPFTRAFRSAAEVTFYSGRLRDRARQLGLDRSGLSVIYPAVGDAFQPRDDATRRAWRAGLGIGEPRVVLNVKRLHELAGQRVLIDAFAKATRGRDDVRLVICGTGPLRQDLERQARDANIASRVTFTGLIPNDEVARYAAVADLFVMQYPLHTTSRREGAYRIDGVPVGKVTVNTSHPRIPNAESSVEVDVLRGVVHRVDLTLEHKAPPVPEAGVSRSLQSEDADWSRPSRPFSPSETRRVTV